MEFTPIGALTIVLGLSVFRRDLRLGFAIYTASTPLGSAAALFLPMLGGLGVQPAHLILAMLLASIGARVLVDPRIAPFAALPRGTAYLVFTIVWAIIGAIFLPRLFAGTTYVNAIGITESGYTVKPIPLAPTSGNFTQPLYLAGDLACLYVTAVVARRFGFRAIVNALLCYSALNALFGAIDILTWATHTGYLLEPIRNASYTLHVDEQVAGLKRIAGSFPEVSAFSFASLGIFGFTARLALERGWRHPSAWIAIATAILLLMSTSATAYVSLPVVLGAFWLDSIVRANRGRVRPETTGFVILAPIALAAVLLAVMLIPSQRDFLTDFITSAVLDKSMSASGVERASWNAAAIGNFFDTYMLGAGLGSVRASSFPIALLGNLGLPGTLSFVLFLWVLFRGTPTHKAAAPEISAARFGCFGMLFAACISGALVDLTLPFFIFAGLVFAAQPVTSRTTYPVVPALRPRLQI